MNRLVSISAHFPPGAEEVHLPGIRQVLGPGSNVFTAQLENPELVQDELRKLGATVTLNYLDEIEAIPLDIVRQHNPELAPHLDEQERRLLEASQSPQLPEKT